MRLHIFTTGGTIDKVYFDARSSYAVGDPQIAEILKSAGAGFEWTLETLLQKDSLEMTDADRSLIAESVGRCPHRHIVITHGTDTMVDTALTVQRTCDLSEKTVIVVGSLAPALHKGSDAEFNIGFAVAAVQTLGPGVYVAMNGRVFPADSVRKNLDENRFEGTALNQ